MSRIHYAWYPHKFEEKPMLTEGFTFDIFIVLRWKTHVSHEWGQSSERALDIQGHFELKIDHSGKYVGMHAYLYRLG